MEFVGSKYFKVDFHCHSPASDDFPRNKKEIKPSYREWLLGLMKEEIDCVILSDHNTAAGVDIAKEELKNLEVESQLKPDNGFRPLTILPAVELTAVDKTHVLAIFREDVGSTVIDNFISQLSPPRNQRDNNTIVLGVGTKVIISKARNYNHDILVIPAHVDDYNGVFKNTDEYGVTDIFEEGPDAVELIKCSDDLPHDYQRKLISSLAQVKGSDAHKIEEIGRGYTWVKMVAPSFDGIKTALTDPEHCIIRSPQQPPSTSSNYITKLCIKSRLCKIPQNNGDEKAVEVNFSPWYSALIGSRGSGKSTLIESIRLALRRDTDKQLTESQTDKLIKFKTEAFDNESFISIEYKKDNELYKFEWTQNGTKMYHLNELGDWNQEERFSSARFPLSIYSQKMLYDIATKNDAFLSVIDASESVDYETWNSEKEKLEIEYLEACSQLRLAEKEVIDLSLIQGAYDDVSRKLARLKNSTLAPLQKELNILKENRALAMSALQSMNIKLNNFENILKPISISKCDENNLELLKFINLISEKLSKLDLDVDSLFQKYSFEYEKLLSSDYISNLSRDIEATEAELKNEVAKLESANILPDELSSLLEQEAILKSQLSNAEIFTQKTKDALEHKKLSYEKLITHRKKITELRINFIQSLVIEDIKIEILPLAGSEESTIASYQKFSGIERFTQNIYDLENSNSLLYDFFKINRYIQTSGEARYAEVEQLKKFHQDITLKKETSAYKSLHATLKRRISQLTPDQVDRFMCWFPEDGLNIKFKDSENQFRQLETASPGQKSASMLSFLMSYGQDPLIIDQPEDDLDCAMLSTTIIPAIKKNKTKRQLIIVTHSAPIVVNGDAEYIFAIKQQSRKLQPVMSGGLQEQDVKNYICSQMEGGETAFKARYKRILG